ncbi:hypothetical protein KIN20_005133 [Parelaphostrongylus tenuis]|uniref:Uncharacterized protein n=1 Tax=Parelaphostrongylus tenuis TaxID=148309 RepID=A0AAD5QEX1_PARTN|nr:hypothetical protein KIN20_005133 [Parelaphostrongylus tenuis]
MGSSSESSSFDNDITLQNLDIFEQSLRIRRVQTTQAINGDRPLREQKDSGVLSSCLFRAFLMVFVQAGTALPNDRSAAKGTLGLPECNNHSTERLLLL